MKPRHVPLRTCVVCREKQPKRNLMRIVRTPDGEVLADTTGRLNGRGGYVCAGDDESSHWGDRQIRARLAQALKTELSQEDIERLSETVSSSA